MINVLIIDDSALIREFLTAILTEDKEINVIASVSDPYKAVEVLNNKKIDVISLDLEMPGMDGLTFLEKLIKQKPIPVVVLSAIAEEGSENAIKALQLGAVEVIPKAKLGIKNFLLKEKLKIQQSIKSASRVNINHLKKMAKTNLSIAPVINNSKHLLTQTTSKIVAIGASTGGTIVLRYILSKLPRTNHGIIITQHMPEGFTKKFSESLDLISELFVKEAEENEKILVGKAIIAQGNCHLKIKRYGAFYQCKLIKEGLINRHRPSVDVMFHSVAENAGKNALGILLTGMGRDGAEGLKAIKDSGGTTIVQDENSCIVYGMPKIATEIGAADYILGIEDIIKKIIEFNN